MDSVGALLAIIERAGEGAGLWQGEDSATQREWAVRIRAWKVASSSACTASGPFS